MLRFLHILLIPLFTISISLGNPNNNNIDSLLRISNNPKSPLTEKLQLGQRAINLAQSDSIQLIKAYSNLGSINLRHSLYKEAITNFKKAILTAKAQNNQEQLGLNYYYLGNVHLYLNDLEKANELYDQSKTIFESVKSFESLGMIYNSLGILHSKKKKLIQSYQAFHLSERIFDSLKMDYERSFPLTNIGDYYLKINEPDSAIFYFEKALIIEGRHEEIKGLAISIGNIGLAYHQKKDYKNAIKHFKKSLKIAHKNSFNKVIYDNYKDLSEAYQMMGNFKQSLTYYTKHTLLKDSIIGVNTKKEIALIYSSYETEKNENILLQQKNKINQLKFTEKINSYKVFLAFSCLSILLISSLFAIFRLRSNLKKKHLEDLLIKSQLDFQENESERLKAELEKTNKDLTSFALDIAQKNEFTQSIDIKLKKIKNSPNTEKREILLQELIFKTHQHLKTNQDFERFQSSIKKVNHAFFEKITTEFVHLTTNEIHLCGLIRLGLTIKDIASIKNISPKSVEMNRYRLRKKLTLKEGQDLYQFLIQL